MNVAWLDASGNGRVHSWTVTHHAFHPGFKPDLPYTLVTVDLDEGVRMKAQLRRLGRARAARRPAGAGGDSNRRPRRLTLPVFVPER